MIESIFELIGILFALCVILLAITKIRGESIKWSTITILTAYSISDAGKIVDNAVNASNVSHETWNVVENIEFYIVLWSFALARLVIFLSVFEVYCIYSFHQKIFSALYRRVWPPHLFIQCFAQLIAIPPVVTLFINAPLSTIVNNIYIAVVVTVYFISIIVIVIVIKAVYHYHKLHTNNSMIRHLTTLIFYFIPITLIDAPLAHSMLIALLYDYINISATYLYLIKLGVKITHMFQTTIIALCTVMVLPSFRKAALNLLPLKRNIVVVVVPATSTNQITRKRAPQSIFTVCNRQLI